MGEMYFAASPQSESRPERFSARWEGVPFSFWTDAGVFSRGEIDRGSEVLLAALPKDMKGRVLDLGCGWGLIGTVIAKTRPGTEVVMSDVNGRAAALARRNLEENGAEGEVVLSDGFEGIDGRFDAVVTNPPIRAGKRVIYRLFGDAAAHLVPGGKMYLVIRKQQGADSALRYLKTIFKTAETLDRSGGFRVIVCTTEAAPDDERKVET